MQTIPLEPKPRLWARNKLMVGGVVLISIVAGFMAAGLLNTHKAYAFDANFVPDPIRADMANYDDPANPASPCQPPTNEEYQNITWVSLAGDSATGLFPGTPLTFTSPVQDINLQFNKMIFLCHRLINPQVVFQYETPRPLTQTYDAPPTAAAVLTMNQTYISNIQVTGGPPATITPAPGAYTPNPVQLYNDPTTRYWFSPTIPFTYHAATPITTTTNIEITLTSYTYNQYHGALGQRICVANGQPANASATGGCPADTTVLDFTVEIVPQTVTVSGHVGVQGGANLAGIKIIDCNDQTATTDANGNYSFQEQVGAGFCLRVATLTTDPLVSSYDGPFDSPAGEGYGANLDCPANGGSAGHCPEQTYEWQQAGGLATTPPGLGYDRSSDSGYNFVYVVPGSAPEYACADAGIDTQIVGLPVHLYVRVSIKGITPDPSWSASPASDYQIDVQTSGVTGLTFSQTNVPYSYNTYGNSQADAENIPIGTAPQSAVGQRLVEDWQLYGPGRVLLLSCSNDADLGPTPYFFVNPYLSVYGGDVSSGEGFVDSTQTGSPPPPPPNATSCLAADPASQGIYGQELLSNADFGGSYGGSGTEFGAQTAGDIDPAFDAGNIHGFLSQQGFGNGQGLSFANDLSAGYYSFGGKLTPASTTSTLGSTGVSCATDFFDAHPAGMTAGNSLDLSSDTAFTTKYFNTSQFTLTQSNPMALIPATQQATVYVKGDVYIANNIIYDTAGAGWTASDLPSFRLIVQGDIYIDAGVTQLDGLYVAQPSSSGGGTIYDCSTSSFSAEPADATLLTNCNNRLIVNGAFVADRVKFSRTFGNIRQTGDKYHAGRCLSASLCNDTDAAEVFNYSPELWLDQTPGSAASGSIQYNSITNLPPVL